MKMGLILVAVVVITSLITITYQLLRTTDDYYKEKEIKQNVTGSYQEVLGEIYLLCGFCLEQKYMDKECFILRAEIVSGEINTNNVTDLSFSDNLSIGKHTLKISNDNRRCKVVKID